MIPPTSHNKWVSGYAFFGCSDQNLPFGQTSDTHQPLGDIFLDGILINEWRYK